MKKAQIEDDETPEPSSPVCYAGEADPAYMGLATSDRYEIDRNKSRLDLSFIHESLTQSYWARDIPLEVVEKSIAHSDCFGLYKGSKQIGFARVISDKATFAYIADLFIRPDERGKGLGKRLMRAVLDAPDYAGLRRWMLATRDAHGLYRKFGFGDPAPGRLMEILDADLYGRGRKA